MVTAYPSYPAYPAASPPQPAGPAPVQVAVAERAPQRRLTVAFRLILVIPHQFILYFLQIAAGVVAFLGWWGALFTGRLPDFAADYLTGYLRWYSRAWAYQLLLTDMYPPFTLDDDPAYPVRIAVTRQPLNRAAVFFRLILIIPAWIVGVVVSVGVGTVLSFVAWLITLVTGKLPTDLHLAFTAAFRYVIRYCSYWLLLTPAYPAGLFGDAPGTPSADGSAAVSSPAPDGGYDGGYGAPSPGYGTGPGYGGGPGYGTAPGYGSPESVYGAPGAPGSYGAPAAYGPARPVFQPVSWQLALGPGPRQLVGLILLLGALTWVGAAIIWGTVVSGAVHQASNINTADNALGTVNSSYYTLTGNMNKWKAAVAACDKNLTCVTKADAKAAKYFAAFASQLQATPMPSGATAAANQLDADATKAAQDFTQLSHTTTVAQYQNTFTDTGLQQTVKHFDQDYDTLNTALLNA